jgi:electron transfer flavoprotein alpha subunit
MAELFVIVEHRQGQAREISLQALWKANDIGKKLGAPITAVVLGGKDEPFLAEIAARADKVIAFEDESLRNFNFDLYAGILDSLIKEHRPAITLMGHTAWGMDLGPALSVRTGFPIATDCVDILIEDGRPKVVRQVYTGKLFQKVSFKESQSYLITVRAGVFPSDCAGERKGELIRKGLPPGLPPVRRQFAGYEETSTGAVDITQADLLVSVGRGICEPENVAIVKELADRMGGVLSCSRPVVDKNWLPKFHQVGTSGKSVKPKVYLALGISGAFQHVAGITGAGVVIAVNKDKKAPIFRVAHYGVVEDLFKIVEALKGKLAK